MANNKIKFILNTSGKNLYFFPFPFTRTNFVYSFYLHFTLNYYFQQHQQQVQQWQQQWIATKSKYAKSAFENWIASCAQMLIFIFTRIVFSHFSVSLRFIAFFST